MAYPYLTQPQQQQWGFPQLQNQYGLGYGQQPQQLMPQQQQRFTSPYDQHRGIPQIQTGLADQAANYNYLPSAGRTNALGGVSDGRGIMDSLGSAWDSMGGWGGISSGLDAISGLGGLYLGFKGLDVAKDNLNFQRDAFNKQYGNQVQLTNQALEDVQRKRANASSHYATPDEEWRKNNLIPVK